MKIEQFHLFHKIRTILSKLNNYLYRKVDNENFFR